MQFQELLIKNAPINIELLNKAAILLQNSAETDISTFNQINTILSQFIERPDAWQCCFPILEADVHAYTKFIALKIMKKFINYNWRGIPDDEKGHIRDVLLSATMRLVEEGFKPYTISMAIQVIIEILKHDWPHFWPTFVPELANSLSSGTRHLLTGVNILKNLADEISSASSSAITSSSSSSAWLGSSDTSFILTRERYDQMRSAFEVEFSQIYSVIERSFQSADDDLVGASIDALSSFIPLVDARTVLSSPLVGAALQLLLARPKFAFRIASLFGKFCSAFSSTTIGGESDQQVRAGVNNADDGGFRSAAAEIFSQCVGKIFEIYGQSINFNCADSGDLLLLANAAHDFMKTYPEAIDAASNGDVTRTVLSWMMQITNFSRAGDEDDDDSSELSGGIFAATIHFWHSQASRFIRILKLNPNDPAYEQLYSPHFDHLVHLLVIKIVSPYSIIVQNDIKTNSFASEFLESFSSYDVSTVSNQATLYENMRRTIVFLFYLKPAALSDAISSQISLVQNGGWNIHTLNSISWSIGAISKVLPPEVNAKLLSTVIPLLISLGSQQQQQQQQQDPTVCNAASMGLLYLCSRESSYFRNSPDFLKSLVQQIYGFICNKENKVISAVALHTFESLSRSCKQTFIAPIENSVSVLEDILNNFNNLFNEIKESIEIGPRFVDSIAKIIAFSATIIPDNIENYLNVFLAPIEKEMKDAYNEVVEPVRLHLVSDIVLAKRLYIIFRFFEQIPLNLGKWYLPRLLAAMPALTQTYGEATMASMQYISERREKQFFLFTMIENEFFNILINALSSIRYADNEEAANALITHCFTFSGSFHSLKPQAISARILTLYGTLISRFSDSPKSPLPGMLRPIFDLVVVPCVNLIKDEYDTFFDFRREIIVLFKGFIRGAPDFLLSLPEESIELFVGAIEWLARHPYYEISEDALRLMYELLQTLMTSQKLAPGQAAAFSERYSLRLTCGILNLLADPTYKFAFEAQTLVLSNLFMLPQIAAQINAIGERATELFGNSDLVSELIFALSNAAGELLKFRAIMKDFLIESRKYSPKDPSICALEIFHRKRAEAMENDMIPGISDKESEFKESTENNSTEDIDEVSSIFASMKF